MVRQPEPGNIKDVALAQDLVEYDCIGFPYEKLLGIKQDLLHIFYFNLPVVQVVNFRQKYFLTIN